MHDADRCLNCGAALTGPYCAACGQKRPHLDLTLREFVHEGTHELVHWDSKIPASLVALFLKPGVLTRDFLEGRRARWVPPFRIYFVCSLIFFLSKPIVETITHRPLRDFAHVSVTGDDGRPLTDEDRRQIAEGLPAHILTVEQLERAAADPAALNHAVNAAFPKAMFVLLPLFALLTRTAWRKRMPRYPAHLYAALHLHAAIFGAFTLLVILVGITRSDRLATVALAAMVGYLAWFVLVTFRRVFGDSWTKTIAKAAAIGVVYAACLMITSFAILVFAVATM